MTRTSLNALLAASLGIAAACATPVLAQTITAKEAPRDSHVSARLVLTQDTSWRSRWQAKPNQLPDFNETHEVSLGQKLQILTLVSGPKPDALGMSNVECDLTVYRPNGTVSAQQRNIPCLRRKVSGDARATYLSTARMTYASEATDQKGAWKVHVKVRDKNSNSEVVLEETFLNH